MWLSFDGKSRVSLNRGDSVCISASQYPLPMVESVDTEWIDSVSRTLQWNLRESQKPIQKSSSGDEWDIDDDSTFENGVMI